MITGDMFHEIGDIPFMGVPSCVENLWKPLLMRVCGFWGDSATIRENIIYSIEQVFEWFLGCFGAVFASAGGRGSHRWRGGYRAIPGKGGLVIQQVANGGFVLHEHDRGTGSEVWDR